MLNFNFLMNVPIFWARLALVILFVAILIFVWSLPNRYIFQGSPNRKWYRNLKLWATLQIAIYFYLYLHF